MTPGPYSIPCRVIHHGNYTVIYLWETSIGSSESIWGTWHGSLLWEPKKVSHTGSLAFQGFHSSCLPHARLSRDKKSKRIPLVLPLLVSTLSSYGSTANLRMSCISALEKSTGKLLRYRFRAEIVWDKLKPGVLGARPTHEAKMEMMSSLNDALLRSSPHSSWEPTWKFG